MSKKPQEIQTEEETEIITPVTEVGNLFQNLTIDNTKQLKRRYEYQHKEIFTEITRIGDETKTLDIPINIAKAHLRLLQELEEEWNVLKLQIIDINELLVGREKFNLAICDTMRMTFRKLRMRFFAIIENTVPSTTTPMNNSVPTTMPFRLPNLELAKFDGAIQNWPPFKTSFETMVHNNDQLTCLHKLQYLKGCVSGEPASIINQFTTSTEAYELSWTALNKRYECKRRIASYYTQQLLNYNHVSAVKYLELHRGSVAALKGLALNLEDYLLFELAYNNLTPVSQRGFDLQLEGNDVPTFDQLMCYVERAARAEELKTITAVAGKPHQKSVYPKKTFLATESTESKPLVNNYQPCPMCKEAHKLFYCDSFKTLNLSERKKLVQTTKHCLNCLNFHPTKACYSRFGCKSCGSKNHHTLLHSETARKSLMIVPSQEEDVIEEAETTEAALCNHVAVPVNNNVLLGTIKCVVYDYWGKPVIVRAVVDPGSEINIITSALEKKLQLPLSKRMYDIQGINQISSKSNGAVELKLKSLVNKEFTYKLSAAVLQTICKPLPSGRVGITLNDKLKNLPLADPEFSSPGEIHLLLGCEAYADILTNDEVPIKGQPTAIKTHFGWVLFGQINTNQLSNQAVVMLVKTEPLDQLLTKFWMLEEISTHQNSEDQCEKYFRETYSRDSNGRYIVRVPLKEDAPELGCNRHNARSTLLRLEQKLSREPSIYSDYNNFMNDYLSQGHMEVVTRENSLVNYILPHHCVFKESTTTRLRVVFDASSKDVNGISVNDLQHTGPSLLRDITDVLLHFRFHRIALTADVKQMYRQILVHPDDCHLQHIYWRNNLTREIQEYELKTLTYGMTSSPFLAQRTLLQLAEDEGSAFPDAAYSIKHQTYMDDCVTGSDTVENATRLMNQLNTLLKKGGFQLQKWASNNAEVFLELPGKLKIERKILPEGEGTKILGLYWEPSTDNFGFHVQQFATAITTKREVASYIAKIYDILGLLAPVIFKAKSFLQNLWLHKELSWDSPLPKLDESQWRCFSSQFYLLSSLRIPRFIPITQGQFRLLCFSDASERGMAAVIYGHVTYPDSTTTCHLLRSKTKLAPLKHQTIPRLELVAAYMLAELVTIVLQQLQLQPTETLMFSDSEIVLTWLTLPTHRLKVFVANRVSKILDLTSKFVWAHVPGNQNPADLATRGLTPAQFLEVQDQWFYASKFDLLNVSMKRIYRTYDKLQR